MAGNWMFQSSVPSKQPNLASKFEKLYTPGEGLDRDKGNFGGCWYWDKGDTRNNQEHTRASGTVESLPRVFYVHEKEIRVVFDLFLRSIASDEAWHLSESWHPRIMHNYSLCCLQNL